MLAYSKGNSTLSFALAIIASACVGIHAIFLDNYLHPWDERYHAVVALNAMDDPFHLKLMPEKLIDWWPYDVWYASYTWLHKQPLFTWQMTIGMKVFGTSLQGMRSSSLVMFMLTGIATYKACKVYFPKAALWIMVMIYLTPVLLLLTSGRQGMDHNDLAFLCWISISFWAFVNYTKRPHIKYALAIGLACGAAMLTKWLGGSLVLFSFGLYLLLSKDFTLKSWRNLVLSGGVALALFLPWQIYSYFKFPEVFLREWEYNGLHFFEVVEEHAYPSYYHIMVWIEEFQPFVLLFGVFLFLMTFKKRYHSPLLSTALISIIAVFLFYGMAATKLKAFTIILLPFVAFCSAASVQWISGTRWLKYILSIILIVAGSRFYDLYLTAKEPELTIERSEAFRDIGLKLRKELPENAVIFNTPSMMYPDMIFYSHRLSYDRVPSTQEVEKVKEAGKEVFILAQEGLRIPEEVENQSKIIDATKIQFFYPKNEKAH